MGLLGSWWNVVFTGLFAAAVLTFSWVRSKLDYFRQRKIVYIKYNWKTLLKSVREGVNLDQAMDQIYQRYPNERYVGYFRGVWPSLLIRDPSLVDIITRSAFSNFHDRFVYGADEENDPLTATLVFLNGPKWKRLRNALAPGFSTSKLQGMFPLMQTCANSLSQQIRKTMSEDDDLNVKQLFSSYTISALVSCGFGIEPEAVKDPECEFRKMIDKFLSNPSSPLKIMLQIIQLEMGWSIMKSIPNDVEECFVKIAKHEMQRRRRHNIKRPDFLQLLMELKDKGWIQDTLERFQEEPHYGDLTNEILTAQMLVFFQAGLESLSGLLSVACHHISLHKDIQDRLRAELKQAKRSHGVLNFLALKDMNLLDRCLSETLRLYPMAGQLVRKCNEDFTLDDGQVIEKGVTVSIPVLSLQRDKKYWNKPEKYDPDRFINDTVVPGSYLPFGQGPRICIGQKLSLLQVKIAVAKILENFEIHPSPKTLDPLQRGKLLDNSPVGGIWLQFKNVEQ